MVGLGTTHQPTDIRRVLLVKPGQQTHDWLQSYCSPIHYWIGVMAPFWAEYLRLTAVVCADENRNCWVYRIYIVNENRKSHGLVVPQSELLVSLRRTVVRYRKSIGSSSKISRFKRHMETKPKLEYMPFQTSRMEYSTEDLEIYPDVSRNQKPGKDCDSRVSDRKVDDIPVGVPLPRQI